MSFEAPKYSKNQVNAAGDYIRDCGSSLASILSNIDQHIENDAILNNWRASHAYVINTFQSNLRGRTKNNSEYIVGQRLKRRPTIIDKLRRHEGMNLSRMHDIAGCRVIFPTEVDLLNFRASFHDSRMKHELRNGDNDRYNYIENPKSDGYRGIHDVYKYNVSSPGGEIWNGLLIEVQYRTKVQHAWATAIEIIDLTRPERIKFGEARENVKEFFRLASEILARAHEGQTSCLPKKTNREVVTEFIRAERELKLMRFFRDLNISKEYISSGNHAILKYMIPSGTLEIETFRNVYDALERYSELEKNLENESTKDQTMDIVMIQSTNPENAREAFKNYFSDATSFVGYIDRGIKALK